MKFEQALSKCMDLCSRREYCAFDIREKIKKWEISPEDADQIIKRLFEEKFLDHERYCRAFVNDKFCFNHWGKVKITYYLKQKQIEASYIHDALNEIDLDKYQGVIREEIKKKQSRVKAKNDFEKKAKIAQSLIAKGFEPGLVFEALKMED